MSEGQQQCNTTGKKEAVWIAIYQPNIAATQNGDLPDSEFCSVAASTCFYMSKF